MGTRAIYIFEDDHEEVYVYKHYNNYPSGAADFIEKAKELAWELPRFEADEFAAAFVAANKNRKGGEVRLVNARFVGREAMLDANHWCDYYYVISFIPQEQTLWVEVYESRYDSATGWTLLDEFPHDVMKDRYHECA